MKECLLTSPKNLHTHLTFVNAALKVLHEFNSVLLLNTFVSVFISQCDSVKHAVCVYL